MRVKRPYTGFSPEVLGERLSLQLYYKNDYALSDCGVGLIEIHLAFYQMNPWVTPLRSFINLWKPQVRFSNFLHFFAYLFFFFSSLPFYASVLRFCTIAHSRSIYTLYGIDEEVFLNALGLPSPTRAFRMGLRDCLYGHARPTYHP